MQRKFHSSSPAQTSAIAKAISTHVSNGDTLLLSGSVGAGKSHFARALITNLMQRTGMVEDIPSPTFTLVQTYDLETVEIWHADLYRLGHMDELYELGLEEAFDTSLCVVEWAERLGDFLPRHALTIHLKILHGDERQLTLEWSDPKWNTIANSLPE